MKYSVQLDPDEVDKLVANHLKEAYVDTMTTWKHEEDSDLLGAALLVVIEYYSGSQDYEAWFETVKDL